jgi:hypothetical protein
MAAKSGERHHLSRLTEDDVMYFRELYAEGGVSFMKLAEMASWKVGPDTIKHAVRGHTWAHLPGAIPRENA